MKESVNDRIMETASRLFYNQGYNLTGINQIIDEAGIAKASLYSHYRSKTDILLAYLDEWAEGFVKNLETHLAGIKGAKNKIFGLFEFQIDLYKNSDYVGCPLLKIKAEVPRSETAVWERIESNKKHQRKIIKKLVQEMDNKSGLSDQALANMIFYLLEGSSVTATVTSNADEIRNALDALKKLI
ncbi:TetR/AcrR family transcriptional regulator [Chitinophaga sp. GCM10012297]|uniref:TetR/AcrR family transcriptional regulator n=1 Tax=Chitinophaga chungangae TaxID=2821488 RepID=A0ABS3YF79_9BACT|nr:TetR/AcrR family transcriptional regulator [Chitinophaga chungangae]MBO9153342.1 TetR/AcrR family transcriptional regulator [Chitinophaga chungangae]